MQQVPEEVLYLREAMKPLNDWHTQEELGEEMYSDKLEYVLGLATISKVIVTKEVVKGHRERKNDRTDKRS